MSVLLAILALAIITVGWFTLALLPALHELATRSDVEPLQLRRGGAGVRHFAETFGAFVDAELPALRRDASHAAPEGIGLTLSTGEPAWYVPDGDAGAILLPVETLPREALATHVIFSESDIAVPSGVALLKELFVGGSLHGGDACFYRAVLAQGDAILGARSDVLRWIDTGGTLVVGEHSVLDGRASAGEVMALHDGVRFQRIAARSMHFGTPGLDSPSQPRRESAGVATRPPLAPPEGVTESWGRWLIEGDFTIPEGETVPMDLVVTGALHVGAGARLGGAVKSAVLMGGEGVTYAGAIIATTRLELGRWSEVAGPIVVEGEAVIGDGSRVGTPEDGTTISAVSVRAGRGAVVCGEVWARAWGEVAGLARESQLS